MRRARSTPSKARRPAITLPLTLALALTPALTPTPALILTLTLALALALTLNRARRARLLQGRDGAFLTRRTAHHADLCLHRPDAAGRRLVVHLVSVVPIEFTLRRCPPGVQVSKLIQTALLSSPLSNRCRHEQPRSGRRTHEGLPRCTRRQRRRRRRSDPHQGARSAAAEARSQGSWTRCMRARWR